MPLSSSNLTTQELVTSHGEGVNRISGRPAGNRLCSLIYANFRSLVTGSELVRILIKMLLLCQNTACPLKEFRSRKKKKMKEAISGLLRDETTCRSDDDAIAKLLCVSLINQKTPENNTVIG